MPWFLLELYVEGDWGIELLDNEWSKYYYIFSSLYSNCRRRNKRNHDRIRRHV